MNPTAYPLSWPLFRQRTPSSRRKYGPYTHQRDRIGFQEALQRVELEVQRLRGDDLLVSTSLKPQDYGKFRWPGVTDPGAAVYFKVEGAPVVLACDTFDELPQNLAGLAAHMEAARRIERVGVQTALETLRGYALLTAAGPPWYTVLSVPADARADAINAAYRTLARQHHPDRGGSEAKMAELNNARDEGLKQAGRRH
jgi:hypothetical protein